MINVYWSNSLPNFGDILTPYILDYYNINYNMVSKVDEASAMCIGSIIHRATDNMIVLGSGVMHSKHKLNPNADYRFVRGPLTREKILDAGGVCPEIFGDPGLLLPLFCEESKKEYDVGIVPHYVDYECVKKTYPNMFVIDVLNTNPLSVAKDITKCKKIISSSLHGIIAAHAYGIPAAWVEISKNVKGKGFKFKDYYASAGIEAMPSTITSPVYTTASFNTEPIKQILYNIGI